MINIDTVIKIAIVDDHPMVLQGLKTMLSHYDDIEVVNTYRNGAELLEGLSICTPDLLILDIQLSDISADELTPDLIDQYPDMKILVLTNFESVMYASKMLWQGVQGYLLKTSEEEVLLHAIRTIYSGDKYIEKSLRDPVANQPLKSKKILAAKTSLTTREKEVLQLIVNGKTDQEIANQLFLSLNTIKHYRLSLLMKLDVNNTAALVNKALKLGLSY